MRRPQFIARQSACPTGILGDLIARIMARETAAENTKALETLNLKAGDYVLEIGFGHGRTIAQAAQKASEGFVAGIDVSERMLRMALRHNRSAVASGRLDLQCGDAENLPYADGYFDKAFSIHTVYFWPRPENVFKEMHRVLKKNGILLLGFRPDEEDARSTFPASVYKFYSKDELGSMVQRAGFQEVEFVDCRFPDRPVLFLLARA
jgi:SAM-dependent methyltransferase